MGDVVSPGPVFQIPVDGLGEAGFEGFEWCPAELGLEFGAVDRIAAVVAGAVGYISDLGGVRGSIGAGGFCIEEGAEGVYHIEVRALIEAADIVSFADAPALQNKPDGCGMVFHVEPIADLLSIAIDRERLAVEGVQDHERDQLFGKMVWAVVVGAVRRESREAVGVLE